MAIRTQIKIYNTDGYEDERIVNEFTSTSYDNSCLQRYTLSGSTSKVEVDFGPVTTANFIYVDSGDDEVTIYRNNSQEGWTFTGPFFIKGCSFTALHLLSTSDASIVVYLAGE